MKIEAIETWFNTLGSDPKKKAKKWFGKINQIPISEDQRVQLFSHSVLAFESLRYRENVAALDEIDIDNVELFLKIFKEFDEVESALYYKITKERLGVIEKLREKVQDENALEKLLQDHIFKYLWLLDPSWERATEDAHMEKSVKTLFEGIRSKLSEEEDRGRMDIKYKTPAGKHVIIELKRASVKISSMTLMAQVEKYVTALEKALMEENPKSIPSIEVICVVGGALTDWSSERRRQQSINSLQAKDIRVVTYPELLKNSYSQYKSYIEEQAKSSELIRTVNNIEMEVQRYITKNDG